MGGQPLLSTGVDGLDDVLGGGLAPNRLYLLEGAPGTGKTTLAFQFLKEGVARGEPVLCVALAETAAELQVTAASHGWTTDGVTIREVLPADDNLKFQDQYTMFHPSEVELSETTQAILEEVDRVKPTRVVVDSLSEFRLLAGNSLRYRRQVLGFKRFFSKRNCTVLLLDDLVGTSYDSQVQSIAHAVVRLEQLHPEYGSDRRRMVVLKYRAMKYRGGYHDYVIRSGGLQVYPRLVAGEHRSEVVMSRCPSGVKELDQLLGGGLERGTSTLIVGAAGTGKSSLAAQFVTACTARGQKSAMFVFDESINTLLSRTTALGIDLRGPVERGDVTVQAVDPAEMAPGQFAAAIREAVERHNASVVVIDSLNGYLNAMPEERFLIIQLHELLSYLGHAGVATLLVGAHHGLIGTQMTAPVDATYLADAVILMRYFESQGRLHQAISVVKKRGGPHERAIREFSMHSTGLKVGAPLTGFRGILTGVPVLEPDARPETAPA